MENLNLFFSRIKELNFWQRVFSWSSIKSLSYDAYDEFKKMGTTLATTKSDLEKANNSIIKLQTEKDGLVIDVGDFRETLLLRKAEADGLREKIDNLNTELSKAKGKITKFESIEEQRTEDYKTKIVQLNKVQDDLEAERQRVIDERVNEKDKALAKMKKQWSDHELSVEQTIKSLCQKHLIKFVDKAPFRGNPDNTICICDEYIIFDAKCPANDDLSNFPKYIRTQTESIKKYTNQEGVRKDIFLVIPTNTIDIISQHTFNMGNYNVYVITKDSLEPVILSLKKIEEYEFAEQLSPEERENICRVIGKFAHTTKRKIQIDQFFANQFIELLVKCKNDLPEDLLKSVIEFEKAEKLNPPSEKRTKQILTKDLKEKNDLINAEAKIREISIPTSFQEVQNLE